MLIFRHEYLNESNHDSPNESNSQEEQSNTDEKSKTKKRRNLRKDHKCAYCSKAFCSQSLLSAHVRVSSSFVISHLIASNKFHFWSVRFTPASVHLPAPNVRNHLKLVAPWNCTPDVTAESNRIDVQCAIVALSRRATLKFTCERTPAKNHINARDAIEHFHVFFYCKFINEHTLASDRTHVTFARDHLPSNAI